MSNPDPIQPQLYTLDSGLRVLLEPNPQARTVAMGFFVNTGTRDEDPTQMGISHFLEHLMFKGSATVSAAVLNERLDALGGETNAYTSPEHTVYHAAALPEKQPELLSTLAVLLEPALREPEIETERTVILEEIEMYTDQPDFRLSDTLRQQYWGTHPLGYIILGTADTVSQLDRATLQRSFEARYGTPQITLVACGKIDSAALLTQATQLSAQWSRQTFEHQYPVHQPHSALSIITDPTLLRQQVALTSPGLSARHPLFEAVQVLTEIMGGDNGRLFWALIDTGLADSADFYHMEYNDTGTFEGGFSCDPERTQQVTDVFLGVLREVWQHGVTEQEVRRAARKLAVNTVMRGESPEGRLFMLGSYYLMGDILTSAQAVQRYTQVTLAQVLEVMALCPLEVLSVVTLGPATTLSISQSLFSQSLMHT